jgi:predicted DNA-binding transcriptional regulator AlpA
MVFKVLQIECDDPEHTFLTERELAENLKFPLSRLMGWRKHGGGPRFTKFGKTVAYKVAEVNKWVEEHTHERIGDRPGPRRSR